MVIKRVQAGDKLRIPASTWNRLIGLLERNPSAGSRGGSDAVDPTTCLVQNNTGADLPWLGVVSISTALIAPSINLDEYLNSFAFMGVLPSATGQYKWGITLEPIALGDIGIVRVSGLCHCYVQPPSSGPLDFAAPDPSGAVDSLVQSKCGARVMYRVDGTGAQRAIIVL